MTLKTSCECGGTYRPLYGKWKCKWCGHIIKVEDRGSNGKMVKKDLSGIPHVVIPTIRNEEHFEKFLKAWEEEFKGCHVIVVEDRPKKQLTKLMNKYVDTYTIYDWKDIDKDLGANAWIIPRQTDCVRSYGYYKAWQNKPLFIVTLDDDVEPQEKHIETFAKKLFYEKYQRPDFFNTVRGEMLFPRGTYPSMKGCDVVHGCWLNVPDLSAEEQIKFSWPSEEEDFNVGLIPRGAYFSMCGMNLAWKPEVTKDMYFGLQGKDYPIDRCGDIWAGYNITSKGYKVYSGSPMCTHTRASNVWSNLKKEKHAEKMSAIFREQFLTNPDFLREEDYWNKLEDAYEIWSGLFNEPR
jgi:hypothetical protein